MNISQTTKLVKNLSENQQQNISGGYGYDALEIYDEINEIIGVGLEIQEETQAYTSNIQKISQEWLDYAKRLFDID